MKRILIALICLLGSAQLQADSLFSLKNGERLVGGALCLAAARLIYKDEFLLAGIVGIPGVIFATGQTENVIKDFRSFKERYLDAKSVPTKKLSAQIPFTERRISVRLS